MALNASIVTSLTVGEGGVVSRADQQADAVTISGTLSAALPVGDTVQVVLPSGVPRPAIVAADGTDFSLVLTGTASIAFSIPGQVSAYVVDPVGNQGTSFTQTFTAAAAGSVVPVTSTPSDFAASGASALALSGDGESVAFVANETVGNTVQFGLYVQRLDTGTLTLVSPDGRAPSLSADGNLVAYQANQNFTNQVFLQDLTTGLVTQLSDPAGGSTSGIASTRPSIADDGTVVFESAGDTALNGNIDQQVFLARVSGGVATRTLISAAADGTPGNGTSEYATISADGSTVVFLSTATNLLSAADPHAAALDGAFQIYALALRDNPVTGQRAGTTVLVSANPDGTVSNGTDYAPVVSGDGRFVVFESASDGQVHLTDLLTGVSRVVSTNADGVVANASSFGATLSADGTTVVFESIATNLLGPTDAAANLTDSQQIYAKNLTTGRVTLLSEGGYTPADDTSLDPTVSADGTVAAFASSADNLTPGVLGGSNRYPAARGYVTAVAGSPSLTFTAPTAAFSTTTVVLTGTIDHAHATASITLTDTADPGFLPVTATVTAGSDPYFDTWTATVIFTQAGPQTVTAAAGDATAQATVTLLNAPSLTIDPVNGTDAIIATGQPGHVTIVTGTNPAAIGGTVSLFLRTPTSALLPLGTATTGADGHWSISVPDAALGVQSFDSDALVAQTVDTSGNKTRAAEAITLSIPALTTLYGYRFTYTDGSFYTGTVADDGTYGYAPAQMITTSGGRYVIGAAAGTTADPVGTVTVASYFDVSTSASYTPTETLQDMADGAGGLGSETDSITGLAGPQSFGGGVTEARLATATAYDFAFVYNDGSSYLGTVVGGATSGYQAGQMLQNTSGYYTILGSQGASTAAIGTVSTSLYYDATSAATYVPVLYSQGKSSGVQGLGSELDTLTSRSVTTTFGLGGVHEAALRLVLTYNFHFFYPDGSVYYGNVIDDGTYGYAINQTIKVQGGTYEIVGVSATSVTLGSQILTPGEVSVYTYYDKSTNVYYTPGDYTAGMADGFQGLGSELDYTEGDSGALYFGINGTREAKQAPDQLFTFTFTYTDGSYYAGSVVDDGSYGYYSHETITTAYGHYYIFDGEPLSAGEGGLVSGQVYTRNYFDVTSGGPYQTFNQTLNVPSGTAGLGSETDFVADPTDLEHVFGDGGLHEAKLTPYTELHFIFYYNDGSTYQGLLSSDGVQGPQFGQVISTAYGVYSIDAYGGATAAVPGTVTISSYYDVTNNTVYTPYAFDGASNFGTSGLPLAVGYTDGALAFGYSGGLEARHAPDTLWNYEFVYFDNSRYSGQVVGNDQSGYRGGLIQYTPYGFFYIFGSAGMTSLPAGDVTISQYFDITTRASYTPTGQGPQGIDGTAGLGSEYADTTLDGHDAEFGFGGQYEAKQSDVYTYSFTFRYTDGSFYMGTVSTQDIYTVGATTLPVTGGNYFISGLVEAQSSVLPGTVSVSSYFAIGGGGFYTPIRYAEGKTSGTSGLGSELDYIAAGSGLRSFGGPSHIEANTSFNASILLTTARYAFDGPIQGATVGYLDPKALPGTLSIDPTQPTATTNADGSYQLDGGTGPLVLTGGTDTATGLAFKGALESAGTGSVLSPITTLIEAVAVARGDTSLTGITAANDLVSTALGLPAGLDLTTYLPGEVLRDPASSANDIPDAEAVYRAGAKLLDSETLIDAAGGASQAAINTVAAALADGSLTDLTDLSPLIEDGGLEPQAETAIKAIVAATNLAVDQQLSGVTVATAILATISGGSIALQGAAATALAADNPDDAAIAANYVQTLPMTLPADDRLALDATIATGPVCFLSGTHILTSRGEVPVERLTIGDMAMTLSGASRPIVWIGKGCVLATRGQRTAATPVIVRKGALAANVPNRDLRITKAHSLYLESVLIPVEFLVNHRSITWDDHAQEVTIYHIELATHDVLLANGAPAESYRDDGNRWLFRNANSGWHLPPQEACAPVLTGGPLVDGVWRRLLDRAGPRVLVPTTDDPDLHLLVEGKRMDGRRRSDGTYLFHLTCRPKEVRIISRVGVPVELGLARDPRSLGLAVRRAVVWQGARLRVIEASDPSLQDGFHLFELDNGFRWTNGDACLPAVLFDGIDGPSELELHVGGTMQYPLVGENQARGAAWRDSTIWSHHTICKKSYTKPPAPGTRKKRRLEA